MAPFDRLLKGFDGRSSDEEKVWLQGLGPVLDVSLGFGDSAALQAGNRWNVLPRGRAFLRMSCSRKLGTLCVSEGGGRTGSWTRGLS